MMEPRTLQFIADGCGGRLQKGDPEQVILGVSTDSRTLKAGECFFAIRGQAQDGHDFIGDAVQRGAAAIVAENNRVGQLPIGVGLIEVSDTRKALGVLAKRYKEDFDPLVVAVVGSNGKTTVKELLGQVLDKYRPTLWSPASYNNDLGVPLTILRLSKVHRFLVTELGTNHPGELLPLVDLVRPKVGVLTSIGREHLEFFRSLAGVVAEEGTIAEMLPEDGLLVVNGDAFEISQVLKRTKARIIRVGFGEGNDWRATGLRLLKTGIKFTIRSPKKSYCGEITVPLLGKHQAVNVLLAVAVCAEIGVPFKVIKEGLSKVTPPPMRMEPVRIGEVLVINDAYNANPDSMIAALRTLVGLPGGGRRIAVLGEMAELGDQAVSLHWEVGKEAALLKVDQLVVVGGELASFIAQGARTNGLERVVEFSTGEEAVRMLRAILRPGDVVLVKASRRSRLEQVVEGLKQAIGESRKRCCTI